MSLPMRRWSLVLVLVCTLVAGVLSAGPVPTLPRAEAQTGNPCEPWPLCKINHLVFIVQENRTFDHYFGTYRSPGGQNVAGLPKKPGGGFASCIPDPPLGHCVKPYHSRNLYNVGGPHSAQASTISVNGGAMNGFVEAALLNSRTARCVLQYNAPECQALTGPGNQPDVMSFHTRREIPNYWAYADYGVLQDHMFAPVRSWSLPSHLYLVSAWSAVCRDWYRVNSCTSSVKAKRAYHYPWADISVLLRQNAVSWNYFVGEETDLQCTEHPCQNTHHDFSTPEGWMPLRWFASVLEANEEDNVRHTSSFFDMIGSGKLANVVWFAPPPAWSEHPGHAGIRPGERYVTKIVNAIGNSEFWSDTAIFITWDDWGGFFDHMKPPKVDNLGYGIRVPGIMVSPYARESWVDHQTLSFDAYLKLIEDRFAGGDRLDPKKDGWPDPRPTVREEVTKLGDLSKEFDFDQAPRPFDPINLEPPGSAGPDRWPERWSFAYREVVEN